MNANTRAGQFSNRSQTFLTKPNATECLGKQNSWHQQVAEKWTQPIENEWDAWRKHSTNQRTQNGFIHYWALLLRSDDDDNNFQVRSFWSAKSIYAQCDNKTRSHELLNFASKRTKGTKGERKNNWMISYSSIPVSAQSGFGKYRIGQTFEKISSNGVKLVRQPHINETKVRINNIFGASNRAWKFVETPAKKRQKKKYFSLVLGWNRNAVI